MGRLKLKRKANGIAGPLPKEVIRCEIEIEKRHSDDWMALHRSELDAGVEPAEATDDDMFVGVNIYGYLAIPNDKVPPKLWRQGRCLLLTLQELSYPDFRAECMADIERQDAPAPEPIDHRAELGDIGAKALEAAKLSIGTAKPGDMITLQDAVPPRTAPWWKRAFWGKPCSCMVTHDGPCESPEIRR
jgi:hypothetical protein